MGCTLKFLNLVCYIVYVLSYTKTVTNAFKYIDMTTPIIEEKIDFKALTSDDLLTYISWKLDFPEESGLAFMELVFRFEGDIKRKAEIYCNKFDYSEVVALEIAHCTFDRVWKYPTFDLKKAKSKDIDKAILLWMYPILYTQLVAYGMKHTCIVPTIDEDLSLVYSTDDMAEITTNGNIEKMKELKLKIEVIDHALAGLTEKHKVIYLTYKVYEKKGKNIPRSISKLLKEKLDLAQSTIRVYKKEANSHVENYLNQINGTN